MNIIDLDYKSPEFAEALAAHPEIAKLYAVATWMLRQVRDTYMVAKDDDGALAVYPNAYGKMTIEQRGDFTAVTCVVPELQLDDTILEDQIVVFYRENARADGGAEELFNDVAAVLNRDA
jgi:hypothetical protein